MGDYGLTIKRTPGGGGFPKPIRCEVNKHSGKMSVRCPKWTKQWPVTHDRAIQVDKLVSAVNWRELKPNYGAPAMGARVEYVLGIYDGPVYRTVGGPSELPRPLNELEEGLLITLTGEVLTEARVAAACLDGQRYESNCPLSQVGRCPSERCTPPRSVGQPCKAAIHCASRFCKDDKCRPVTERCPTLHELAKPANAPSEFWRCSADSDCAIMVLPACYCSPRHAIHRDFLHCANRFPPPPCVRRINPPRCPPAATAAVCRNRRCVLASP